MIRLQLYNRGVNQGNPGPVGILAEEGLGNDFVGPLQLVSGSQTRVNIHWITQTNPSGKMETTTPTVPRYLVQERFPTRRTPACISSSLACLGESRNQEGNTSPRLFGNSDRNVSDS